jgi:plasmid stabilization system protein ParE
MTYVVAVTPAAEADIASAFSYIHERAPLNAQRWVEALYKSIDDLEFMPNRCAKAREAEAVGEDLRQLVFKSHRVIFKFSKSEKVVRILRVRHAAMLPLSPEELAED